MSEIAFVDIHRHTASVCDDVFCIVNLDHAEADLPDCAFSFGLHPWCIGKDEVQHTFRRFKLLADCPKWLAVGECGLDRAIDVPMAQQIEYLTPQLELAQRLCKPVIMHCVRAFNELLALRVRYVDPPWIIHGFDAHPQLARRCVEAGCYLSFGKALLRPQSKAAASLCAVSPQAVFFETDAANGIDIADIYAAAATISGFSQQFWRSQVLLNYRTVFNS
jgi:TatD DNase family protein